MPPALGSQSLESRQRVGEQTPAARGVDVGYVDLGGTRRRTQGVRTVALASSIAVCLAFAGAAQADVGLTITTLDVRAGGILRGFGNASGMPVYLVPERHAPRPMPCRGGTGYCAPRSWQPPGRPYVLLGHLRKPHAGKQRFAFRVPRVAPERYQVALWCKPCGRRLPGRRNALRAGDHRPKIDRVAGRFLCVSARQRDRCPHGGAASRHVFSDPFWRRRNNPLSRAPSSSLSAPSPT